MSKAKSARREPTISEKPSEKPAMPEASHAAPSDKAAAPARDRYTYQLKNYSAERRRDGWWIARTPLTAIGDRAKWDGPYPSIEDCCLAIARHLATELANRHHALVAAHKIAPDDPLYGFQQKIALKPKR